MQGERKLPIVIGTNEAQSIAIAIEKEIKPPRPLTHDLFKNFCVRFDIKIKQVIIHKLVDGVFYSSVICERDGIEEIIDSRSSDAIALAIRFEAPIYTYENILEKAGVVIKLEKEIDEKSLLKELFSEENSEVENSEINIYLEQSSEKYDLFIATDLLIYIGDLKMLFSNISKASTQKGIFVFSTELVQEVDYSLTIQGRYAHSENYIRKLAQQNKFNILNIMKTEGYGYLILKKFSSSLDDFS